jgi:hypothetical protein
MKTRLLCLSALLLLTACDNKPTQQSTPTNTPDASNAPHAAINVAQVLADTAARQNAQLHIKGFSLGMDIHDVPAAMMDMLAEQGLADYGFTAAIKTGGGSQCVLLYTKSYLAAIQARMEDRYGKAVAQGKTDGELLTACLHSDGVMTVKADAGRDVSSIEFSNVKDLFDAPNLTAAQFAAKLGQELQIAGELKPNTAQTVWIYRSPAGEQLEISSEDVLGIPRIWLRVSKAVGGKY